MDPLVAVVTQKDPILFTIHVGIVLVTEFALLQIGNAIKVFNINPGPDYISQLYIFVVVAKVLHLEELSVLV
jgi:hypothetical protein